MRAGVTASCGRGSADSRWLRDPPAWHWAKAVARIAPMLVVAFGLSAPLLLPAEQLSRRSVRAGIGYDDATQFSVQPVASVQLILPKVFGDNPTNYWSAFASGEIWGYAGVAALALASSASSGARGMADGQTLLCRARRRRAARRAGPVHAAPRLALRLRARLRPRARGGPDAPPLRSRGGAPRRVGARCAPRLAGRRATPRARMRDRCGGPARGLGDRRRGARALHHPALLRTDPAAGRSRQSPGYRGGWAECAPAHPVGRGAAVWAVERRRIGARAAAVLASALVVLDLFSATIGFNPTTDNLLARLPVPNSGSNCAHGRRRSRRSASTRTISRTAGSPPSPRSTASTASPARTTRCNWRTTRHSASGRRAAAPAPLYGLLNVAYVGEPAEKAAPAGWQKAFAGGQSRLLPAASPAASPRLRRRPRGISG